LTEYYKHAVRVYVSTTCKNVGNFTIFSVLLHTAKLAHVIWLVFSHFLPPPSTDAAYSLCN